MNVNCRLWDGVVDIGPGTLADFRLLTFEFKNINTIEYKHTTACIQRREHTKYAPEKRTQGQMCILPLFKGTVSRDI